MEKAKNSIIIKKAKDLQEAKEVLQFLLPNADTERDIYFTTRHRKLRETNPSDAMAVNQGSPGSSEDDQSRNTANRKTLVSIKAKMSAALYDQVMKEKRSLAKIGRYKHLYVEKFLTKAEKERDYNLRRQKAELMKNVNEAGIVEYEGEKFDTKKGTFKVVNLELKFFSYPNQS